MKMNSKSLSTITSGPSSRPSCFSSGEAGARFYPPLLVVGASPSFSSCGGVPSTFCSVRFGVGVERPEDPYKAGTESPGMQA